MPKKDLNKDTTNGHANRHANGHANRHANGHANRYANGHANREGESLEASSKSYRQLKNAESGRDSLPQGIHSPVPNGQPRKQIRTRNIIQIGLVVFMYLGMQ